jgi:phenylacetate-CoA ligase
MSCRAHDKPLVEVQVADDRYFEPEAELMSRPDIERLQEEKILELVPYAYERSALYRRTWDAAGVHPRDIKSMDDFHIRIPFIDKDMIRSFREEQGDPFGGLLCVDSTELSAIQSSSGTTGDATFFPEMYDKWAPLSTSSIRDLWEHGLRPGDHVICSGSTFRNAGYEDMRQIGCIPHAVNTMFGAWRDVLDTVEKYDVRCLYLVGPLMGELERIADERDMRAALAPVKFMSFAGEPLGERLQRRVREEWDTRLAMWTSAGDTGAAWQCREHNGHHLWEDRVVAESLHPETMTPVADGDIGELVVTDIDNLAAPLIRFRSEDLIRLARQSCGCGRTHARMWPLGRAGDRTVVQGQAVMPMEVWSVVERFNETRSALFQIVRPQRELDELLIRVGYAPERTRSIDELRQRLEAEIASAIGVTPVLEMVEEQQIIARVSSAGKIPRIVKA